MRKIHTFLLFLIVFVPAKAQLLLNAESDSSLFDAPWDALWVSVPESDPNAYGVYLFRNTFDWDQSGDEFVVHISADMRYKLYLNEQLVGLGPARSDPDNWNYDSYELTQFLKPGKNIISAKVWNYGSSGPGGQLSLFSGFLMQGNSSASSVLNTPGTWLCKQADAYNATYDKNSGSFSLPGPGDHINGALYPWDWKSVEYNDSDWLTPASIYRARPKGVGAEIRHALVPRTIPAMEYSPLPSPRIRHSNPELDNKVIHDYIIPANSKTTILLDQGRLVTAYPELTVSGGKKSSIKTGYAEALSDDDDKMQYRDLIENMYFREKYDIFIPDGESNRIFTTLWFRTYRYIQLEIRTQDEPLTIHSLDPIFTAYPFMEKAWFNTDHQLLTDIWKTGWNTSRLCANETFFDSPCNEQLQYIGDTRINALVTLYVSGDKRLMRKAIDDIYHSIVPEGLTQSRFPSDTKQVIPTYSLLWVSMIYDYLWHCNDPMFASKYLVSIQHILQWFENRIDKETGMLGPIEYWPFVDWTDEWQGDAEGKPGGVPAGSKAGNSSIITFQYALTLDQASDIFNFFGLESIARSYNSLADQLVEATKIQCWDETKQFFADTPKKNEFSQHANILAILCSAIPDDEKALLADRTARSKELIQASAYFRFYLHRAMLEAGLGNKFLEMLEPENTRSDCHAWSSSPLYEFLSVISGFRPAEFGFKSIIIEPHPGQLKRISSGIPHPLGIVEIDLQFDTKGNVKGNIILPKGLSGIFVWDKQTQNIEGGKNKISLGPLDSKYK